MANMENFAGNEREETELEESFSDFDELSFQNSFVVVDENNIGKTEFAIEGIHCAACVWLLEKLPTIVDGVLSTTVSWARSTVSVRWTAEQVKLSKIAQVLNHLGYKPHAIRENTRRTSRANENRRQLSAIGLSAAAAGNNMMIAAALYYGMFNHMAAGFEGLLRWTSCAVGVFAVAFPGRVFLQGAWNAMKTRTPHMDLPIAIGLSVGTTAGLINTFRGTGEIYFDSLSVLVFLLLLGRWIQFRQQNNAADSVELLYRMTPKYAWRIDNGIPTKVTLDQIVVGDVLEIRAGDVVPVDAEIVEGRSYVDESILTGESVPVKKEIGGPVAAGTQNIESILRARAVAVGKETRLSRIVSLIEDAANHKPKIVEWANRIGAHFVIAIIVAAAVTFFVWLPLGASVAVNRAVALLIVACPCALALATPLAISVALGRAARNRIMIKAGDVFQRLDQKGVIWLDKTGTLTMGKLQVVEWVGCEEVKSSVAALEHNSSHPVAKALAELDSSDAQQKCCVVDFVAASNGVSGVVDGVTISVGNKEFTQGLGVVVSREWEEICEAAAQSFCSPVLISENNQLIAIAMISDRLRQDSMDAVRFLKSRGWNVGLLSGDHQAIADQVGKELCLDPQMVHGGMQPEEKVSVVNESLKNHETVVMVGDGVNDCAALGAASVGIAVRNGAEASLAAAPVYLAENGLAPLKRLVKISDSTNKIIRANLAISIGYNIVGAGLAATGVINPLIAAILMPISSLTVVAISLGAGRTADQDDPDKHGAAK